MTKAVEDRLLPVLESCRLAPIAPGRMTPAAIEAAAAAISGGAFHTETLYEFLIVLAPGTLSVDELLAFQRAFSAAPPLASPPQPLLLDLSCSWRGRERGVVLSAAGAVLTAAAGVPVLLRGHARAALRTRLTLPMLLKRMGVALNLAPDDAAAQIKDCGLAFLDYSRMRDLPASVIGVRFEIASETFFDVIEQCWNPFAATAHVGGYRDQEVAAQCGRLSAAMAPPGRRMLLAGNPDGAEEIRPGKSRIVELRNDQVLPYEFDSMQAGVDPSHAELHCRGLTAELMAAENIARMEALFTGRDRGGLRQAVFLNTALQLYAARAVASWPEGMELAEETLDSGAGWTRFRQWLAWRPD